MEEYRGITLMSMVYKIYAEIHRKRLESEIEEKGIIPYCQTDFRNEVGMIENI